ncbi:MULTISPECIES: DUF4921 family protein [unclassified Corynebacterium]|uniref:DUF4921 family protein n=1 Tax=unclassified Corynebacterium TaxID=2624378 RepID=UPI0021682D61|nr:MULTISPECIES: DUF4921 family protein [unclassified Corynebacterium]MCS4490872.1 DUF4921 family protein [Corynebacterium sp. ES2715-CONJ3]MCS4531245.1 DUF4921 family protein [Corynebacterium sp. ES2730-CONJ]
MSFLFSRVNPIQTMADGTIKQINPFSGTEVWTVPGRGHRPLDHPARDTLPITPGERKNYCAFCSARLDETPPEKARVIRHGENDFEIVEKPSFAEIDGTEAEFRRVSNLFEIVSYAYWQANYGFEMNAAQRSWMQQYQSDPRGIDHILRMVKTKRQAAGLDPELPSQILVKEAESFFGGGHDLIIGRRHFSDHAHDHTGLASAGSLSVVEHRAFIQFTIHTMQDLYSNNRYTPYVAVFQNWLKPAGASFDHLHKQLVSIDERGLAAENEVAKLRQNPNMYNEWAVNYAAMRNLVIAENEHAICFAGFGHRYPTLEVYSKSPTPEPWLQTPAEVASMSDLIHACHAAVGPHVPSNEEWHHKPIDLDIPMPWRVMIKWRVSTLAGFEGGTKVYLNTLSPWDVRDRVVSSMFQLRDSNSISSDIRIATECTIERNSLKYNRLLPL